MYIKQIILIITIIITFLIIVYEMQATNYKVIFLFFSQDKRGQRTGNIYTHVIMLNM